MPVPYMKLRELFNQTREWRIRYHHHGNQIEAAYCACREAAILDCMVAVGDITKEQAMKMEKMKWDHSL